MRNMFLALSLAGLTALPVPAQEPGTPIFSDSFDTPATFADNWVIAKGYGPSFKSFATQVQASCGMAMRRETPDDFWAEMDLTFDCPSDSRAGFAVGKHYFLITPGGYTFGWRGQPVDGFEIGKPTRLTLARKRFGASALYVFKANGKELQRAFQPWEEGEKPPLSTFCYGPLSATTISSCTH